jgi:multidrug resistance efflux pump
MALRQLEFEKTRAENARSIPEKLATVTLSVVEAEEKLAVAETKAKWLKEYVRDHETARLKLELLEAELELMRHRVEWKGKLARAEADVRAAEAMQVAEQTKLDRLEQRFASCQIRAPKGGIVVYPVPTSTRGVRTPSIEVGAAVRERQELLRVVDRKSLQVRVKVDQSKVGRVRVGQPVVLQFDALVDRSFEGKVVQVGTTPEATSWLDGNIKQYAVVVSIENAPDTLRLGMTAVAEIDVSNANRPRPGIGPRPGRGPRPN